MFSGNVIEGGSIVPGNAGGLFDGSVENCQNFSSGENFTFQLKREFRIYGLSLHTGINGMNCFIQARK